MPNTRLFKNGHLQAVHIPADLAYAFVDMELVIERVGDELRIRPAARRVGDVMGALAKFSPGFMAACREANEESPRDPL